MRFEFDPETSMIAALIMWAVGLSGFCVFSILAADALGAPLVGWAIAGAGIWTTGLVLFVTAER